MLRIYILLLLYWGLSIAVPLLTVDHAASPFVADIGGRSNVHNSFRALNDRFVSSDPVS
jgi:hypothetical protein